MKIFLVLLVTAIFFVIGEIDESFAEKHSAIQEHPSLPEISLQLQLRNSEGQLVTYLEPTTKYLRNVYLIHQFLDTKENKTIIQKDGKLFEEIQYQQKASFTTKKQIATYGMVHDGIFVLVFRHDGYLTSPGDTLDVSWKIVRTID